MQATQDKVLQLFFRDDPHNTEEERKLGSFLDRLLIRIFSSTSLITYLNKAALVDDHVELAFNELPPDVIDKVVSIIGVPGVEVFLFNDTDNHHPFHGFRFKPPQEALDAL